MEREGIGGDRSAERDSYRLEGLGKGLESLETFLLTGEGAGTTISFARRQSLEPGLK